MSVDFQLLRFLHHLGIVSTLVPKYPADISELVLKCPDTSAWCWSVQRTFRPRAKLSWVWSVLGPKCPVTLIESQNWRRFWKKKENTVNWQIKTEICICCTFKIIIICMILFDPLFLHFLQCLRRKCWIESFNYCSIHFSIINRGLDDISFPTLVSELYSAP